jgi:hypothetical protein
MVQFPQCSFRALFVQSRITGSRPLGYPIRQPADLRMFAPPRRFSQLAAAFLASIRQGIHLKPFSRLTILFFLGTKASAPTLHSLAFRPSFGGLMPPVKDHNLLEIRGLEPLTSSLQSWRSSQLSYIPE